MPEYANQTTLLVTTDHGRGATTTDWTDHGTQGAGGRIDVDARRSARAWRRSACATSVTVTTSQLAATIAAVVGEDFSRAVPAAAPRLPTDR